MTFYDDAEFAAIKAVRTVIDEAERGSSDTVARILDIVNDMEQRHGNEGLIGLVLALARHQYAALHKVAADRTPPETVDDVLASFELHKLEQIDGEGAEPDED